MKSITGIVKVVLVVAVVAVLLLGWGTVWSHVTAVQVESAEKILFAAQQSGFKRSGIQAVNPERVLVEICSTEILEVPLAEERKQLVDDSYLEYLVDVANTKFGAGRKKLERLEEKVKGF